MNAPIPPLSRFFRSSLWWVSVAVFVVGTPILIGYSKGYRLNDALLLVQTGGVYIHSDLANTRVYFDGEFVEENGTFMRNTLVQDLVPNKGYKIWVEKDGYQSWGKVLWVQPNLVTEATIMMLPDFFEWTIVEATTTIAVMDDLAVVATTSMVSQEVLNPHYTELTEYFTEDREQFAVEIATTTYEYIRGKRVATTTTIHELRFPKWLDDLASTSALYDKTLVREMDGIVAWLADGNLHVTWARENDAPPYYFCNATCTPSLEIDWGDHIKHYDFYPNRSDVVILDNGAGVFAVELDARSERNIQKIYEGRVEDFRILQDGTLVVYDGEVYRETSW
ncbi:MAG: hypothetical protein KBD24_00465 [Candidatus Pacebacteria bacterium]|nr:hypothetical protein [Candidatus Paceibacterota bacterium]